MPKPVIDLSSFTVDNHPFYIHQDNRYFYSAILKENDCGYEISFDASIPTNLVFPLCDREILVADELKKTDTSVVRLFYHPDQTPLISHSGATYISTPVVHLIGDQDVWSLSVAGECLISVFMKNYQPYVSICGVPVNGIVTYYLDVATNYSINLQRHPIEQNYVTYNECLNLAEMQDVIFHAKPVQRIKHTQDDIITRAQSVSDILHNNVFVVATGSLAQILNGMDCQVNDYDFMCINEIELKNAVEILCMHGFACYAADYKHFKLSKGSVKVDIAYDNYGLLSVAKIKEKHDIKYLGLSDLLWLCLINDYEQNSTHYPDSYQRNKRALYEINKECYRRHLPCNDKLARLSAQDNKRTLFVEEMSQTLSVAKHSFIDVRINRPYRVNTFETEDVRYYTIVNLGDAHEFRLVTPIHHKIANWNNIDGDTVPAKIEHQDNLTMIFVSDNTPAGVMTAS